MHALLRPLPFASIQLQQIRQLIRKRATRDYAISSGLLRFADCIFTDVRDVSEDGRSGRGFEFRDHIRDVEAAPVEIEYDQTRFCLGSLTQYVFRAFSDDDVRTCALGGGAYARAKDQIGGQGDHISGSAYTGVSHILTR